MIEAMPSAPALPLGPALCASHADGQRSGLPTKEYLTSIDEIVPCVCQPQYCVQNPLVSFTSEVVSTKYTPLVSRGSRPLVIALLTIAWIAESLSAVPCE